MEGTVRAKAKAALIGCLFWFPIFVLYLVLMQGCASAPTPVPIPSFDKVERALVPESADDSTEISITLGEARQALSDSEALEAIIPITNKAIDTIEAVTEDRNAVLQWGKSEQEKGWYRAGVGVAVGFLLSLIFGG